MYVIRDATNAFAKLDHTPADDIAALDKSLRNLTQRAYIQTAGRQGRAEAYPLKSICALRLMYTAFQYGLGRGQVAAFSQYLQVAPAGALMARAEKVDGGIRPLSPIEEAIERTREGESFDMGFAMLSDGTFKPFANWNADQPNATVDAILGALETPPPPPVDAKFDVPASRLIAELMAELGA